MTPEPSHKMVVAESDAEALAAAPPHVWEMVHDNRAAWSRAMDALEDARDRVDIEHYIIEGRGVGARLLDLLALKARQGVQVRVMADGFGSWRLGDSAAGRTLRKAGGKVFAYNRFRAVLMHPFTHLRRLHRKSIIIDGQRLLVGGTCFADRMEGWRDTLLDVSGPVAGEAQRQFDFGWRGTNLQLVGPRNRQKPRLPERSSDWSYLVCGPRPVIDRQLARGFREALRQAEERIIVTTPYLWLDRPYFRALAEAVARGVQVRLLLPARSDHPIIHYFTMRHARQLAARGVEVFAYQPAMYHAKLALIDRDWASVGSFNLDLLSILYNLENAVVSRDADFVAALDVQLEKDFAAGVRI